MSSEDLKDAVRYPAPVTVSFTVRSEDTRGEDCYWCGGEIDPNEGVSAEVETSPGKKKQVLVHAKPCLGAMQEAEPF